VVLAERGRYPDVDFLAATGYPCRGIPTGLPTPVFPVSRLAGWTAHVIEQHADNRLIRPGSEYIGERGLTWTPLAKR
jgi:citrate synthase